MSSSPGRLWLHAVSQMAGERTRAANNACRFAGAAVSGVITYRSGAKR